MSGGAISGSPNLIHSAGNPNGSVAGFSSGGRNSGAPPDILWDGQNFWVCTRTGDDVSTVWSPLSSTSVQIVVVDLGTVINGTVTFDRAQAPVQKLTVAGAFTVELAGWLANSYSDLFIELTDGGSQTITWPDDINWIIPSTGATTTSFSTYGVGLQTSGIDFVIFWSPDGGATKFGKIVR